MSGLTTIPGRGDQTTHPPLCEYAIVDGWETVVGCERLAEYEIRYRPVIEMSDEWPWWPTCGECLTEIRARIPVDQIEAIRSLPRTVTS